MDYDREKALYDKGLVSGDEYDQRRKAYQQAQEEVRAANDNLEVVTNGVSSQNAKTSSTLVRSTIGGLVLDVPVKVAIQSSSRTRSTTALPSPLWPI